MTKKKIPPAIPPLEDRLGHRFADRTFLERALTHSSLANEAPDEPGTAAHNEQSEFLGDAVLGFVTSRAVFDRFPDAREGQLSKTRAHLVSARHLVKMARKLSLGDELRLGRGEERSGGRLKAALLADALEAVIAALYLDGGLEVAERFIRQQVLGDELERIALNPEMMLAAVDQKSALQEYVQSLGQPQPAYQIVQEEGPDHRKHFTVELRLHGAHGELVQRGEGPTKKKAEQHAAQAALEILKRQAKEERKHS